MHYVQLSQEQRYHISALKEAGLPQVEIARRIGKHPSTVSRELKRNSRARHYQPETAQQLAVQRRRQAHTGQRVSDELVTWVECLLTEFYFSPEQIVGWLKQQYHEWVSVEWIYRHIEKDQAAGGQLYRCLRHQRKRYRKRYGSHQRRGQIKDPVSIEQRPAIVDERSRVGDWEMDTVIGKQQSGVLLTLVERKSGLLLMHKLKRRTASAVSRAVIHLLKPYRTYVQTITTDNGKEFANHKAIAKALQADFYFAHPYASWERGSIENVNGLVRQFFPKNTRFDRVTRRQVKVVTDLINLRPRKRHNFRSPLAVFRSDILTGTIALNG